MHSAAQLVNAGTPGLGPPALLSVHLSVHLSVRVSARVSAQAPAAPGLTLRLAGSARTSEAGQPQGIIGTSGVGAVTGTAMAYAGMLEFQTDIGNALSPSCGYVTTPAVAALLMQRVKFSGTASPLWDGNILDANACGFRGMSSAQVPTADIVFGAWDQVVMAEWGSLAIEVNPYANFQAGLVGVRAMYAMDIGLRVPGAFSVATTVT